MKLQVTADKKFIKVIEASSIELAQLKMSFTKEIEGARFNPLVKRGVWDGKISFVQHGVYVPVGLWNEVLRMGKKHEIPVEIYGLEGLKNFIPWDEFRTFFEEFFRDKPMKPRDYQIEAAYKILNFNASNSEIATSAGKTLICFMCFVWMVQKMGFRKVLMVVPKTQLVEQGIADFQGYNDFTKFQYFIKGISQGDKDLATSAHMVIGTFQTLVKREEAWLSQFDGVIIDESHTTKAASLKTIILKCKGCRLKFGLSGTLSDNGSVTDFTVQSYLGPMIQKISPDFLIQNGYATPIKIRSIWMEYLEEEEKERLRSIRSQKDLSGSEMYALERRIVVENQKRFKFITEMISKVTKNTLVLFSNIKDDYGKRVYDRIKELTTDKEVYYVDGGTGAANREYYKGKMEEGTNKIMVASFGTTSTGISIKNIHTIFFIESYKSETIIKQSIGRGMRLHGTKDYVTIVDFVDDFSSGRSKAIIAKHGEARLKIYKNENFPVETFRLRL